MTLRGTSFDFQHVCQQWAHARGCNEKDDFLHDGKGGVDPSALEDLQIQSLNNSKKGTVSWGKFPSWILYHCKSHGVSACPLKSIPDESQRCVLCYKTALVSVHAIFAHQCLGLHPGGAGFRGEVPQEIFDMAVSILLSQG